MGREGDGHLLITLITDWCYTAQTLIDVTASVQIDRNLREQEGYEREVIAFYWGSNLPFGVTVHREINSTGHRPTVYYAVDRIVGDITT